MAGSIALSLTQRYDKNSHVPLDGGFLYFYAAGTTTPQSAYQDISLTIPWENPLILDSGGNVPQLFFADGYIKFRLANSAGVTQIAADFVLVLGPTSGGGAAPSVDPTTILQTGWLQPIYGTGNITGFVRCNGRTIGNAASGASERANADTVALFSFLYGQDTNLVVSGGRGANAAADYAANKTIALPDWAGRAMAFLDDMGAGAKSRLTATYFGTSPTVLGAASTQLERRTLVTGNLPPYTPSGTINGSVPIGEGSFTMSAGGVFVYARSSPLTTIAAPNPNFAFSGNAQGGLSTPFSIIPPEMLATLYIKL